MQKLALREEGRGRGGEGRGGGGGGSIFASPDAPELIIEFCDKALLASASSCEALYNALRSLGYTTFVIDMENGMLQPLNQSREFEYANIFATKSPARHRSFIVS